MAAVFGLVLLCAGGLLAAFAVSRPISIGGTVNLGLMCDRLSLLIGAAAVSLIGAAFMCTHAIVSAVKETIRRQRYD